MAEAEALTPAPTTRWYRWVTLPIGKAAMWLMFTVLGPTYVKGSRRVPREGGLLILANHQSDVDPILVQLACHRAMHFMAKSELFGMKVVGKLIRRYQGFPVKRGEPDRASIRMAVELLRMGEPVCVFPEGELSETGEILPLKPGVALLVRMSGARAICVGLRNTRRMMPYGTTTPRPAFKLISARWGESRSFDKHASNEEILEWATAELLRLADQSLMPPERVPPPPQSGT